GCAERLHTGAFNEIGRPCLCLLHEYRFIDIGAAAVLVHHSAANDCQLHIRAMSCVHQSGDHPVHGTDVWPAEIDHDNVGQLARSKMPASIPRYRAPLRVASSSASCASEATGSRDATRCSRTGCLAHSKRSWPL